MSNYVFRFDNGVYDGSAKEGSRISGTIIIDGKKCKIDKGVVGNCVKSNSVCGTETETDEVINDVVDQVNGSDTPDITTNIPDTTTPPVDLPIYTTMDEFIAKFNANSPPGITLMT